ncbi:3-carboxy-cis,cis-muconate cycloisomerase [Umezawaea endophytica]|uniref:3-carboxy-cis,cis-muconate cycloisomerase n=1 Tax=Umezawaea endophytica TaxID=1654476 RepID=A0A9X2VR70_9PSEU|nr:3-carboxy-cis,cis-muconate cycloisomerase [Umezawaea endophytica]MCS7481144.1 3-carboxy-cis,cis-muconate cycloisomerase [Umezawaea endophytica]
MKPSSSTSELFRPLFGDPIVDAELGDRAWLRAMLDFERALVVVQSHAGIVPVDAARAIVAAIDSAVLDPASLGARATASGNPVVPLVRDLVDVVPADARAYVHHGATSQDVLDTAASLVAFRALRPILDGLAGVADECERLAVRHRDTLIAGRTLGQQAVPTTFGLKCAGWLVAVDEARERLSTVRAERLAVQFGGAAGTLAPLGTAGASLADRLADELGLVAPVLPWHTDRTRFAELAGALGSAAGVLAKIAQDVLLMAQTEVGEVEEADGGTSSAMPHKRNPVRAVLVTAAAKRVPGLVATVLASMAHEHERAAGGWHAEWETSTDLLRLVGGAVHGTWELLARLEVHPEVMRRNLDLTGGLPLAENVSTRLAPALGRSEAQDLVAEVCREAVATGSSLLDALLADFRVQEHLSADEIGEALDPSGYVGSAAAFVDRALVAHQRKAER